MAPVPTALPEGTVTPQDKVDRLESTIAGGLPGGCPGSRHCDSTGHFPAVQTYCAREVGVGSGSRTRLPSPGWRGVHGGCGKRQAFFPAWKLSVPAALSFLWHLCFICCINLACRCSPFFFYVVTNVEMLTRPNSADRAWRVTVILSCLGAGGWPQHRSRRSFVPA